MAFYTLKYVFYTLVHVYCCLRLVLLTCQKMCRTKASTTNFILLKNQTSLFKNDQPVPDPECASIQAWVQVPCLKENLIFIKSPEYLPL